MPKTPRSAALSAPDGPAMPSAATPPVTSAAPSLIAVRHPRAWPLAFGDYATGGVIHRVDADTAALLLRKGFVKVPDAPPGSAPAESPAASASAQAQADLAARASAQTPVQAPAPAAVTASSPASTHEV